MKSLNKFVRHFVKNQFWVFTAAFDYALAVFLIRTDAFFEHPPLRWIILSYLDDPLVCAIIFGVATYTLTVALWDLSWFRAGPIVAGLNVAMWILFGMAFWQHSIQVGGDSLYPAFCFITAVRVLIYAATGNHKSGQVISEQLKELKKAGNKGGG